MTTNHNERTNQLRKHKKHGSIKTSGPGGNQHMEFDELDGWNYIGRYRRPDWYDQAACKGLTDLFFSVHKLEQRQAVTICTQCSVRQECADLVATTPSTDGVWAGIPFLNGKTVGLRQGRRKKSEALSNHHGQIVEWYNQGRSAANIGLALGFHQTSVSNYLRDHCGVCQPQQDT